jgi:HAE1 family hydrophobic/amphiphilic exporter-1
MNIAELSIKRPIFITCLATLLLVLGLFSFKKLPVDLFPNVTFPVVMIMTPYPGAGPEEVENLVSRIIEDDLSTLPGIKTLKSINKESVSTVVAEFTLETDIKYAEQLIRDRVSSAKRRLPTDIDEPIIRRVDPADQPILIMGITADLPPGKMYDLANEVIKPKYEQIPQVGSVEVYGGRKREIQVELDRRKMKSYEVSAMQVSQRIGAAGMNIPAGSVDESKKETVFRTVGEFKTTQDISQAIVNFIGNDVPVTVADIGRVTDGLADEKSRVFVNGETSLFMMLSRQSGANTIAVADAVIARTKQINEELKNYPGFKGVTIVRDGSKPIRANVDDVKESIFIGIALTIMVVFFFLGSGRSTFITGLALPNSLVGAFLLMVIVGFTINMMSLLALSLAVGLLIDDAIVVRENIFRHNEMGKDPVTAAVTGTKEVLLAVIATTLTVVAVFGSIGFISGVVGQFFKEFGLTVCFAMMISLFDALTMAPMLSAYFAGGGRSEYNSKSLWGRSVGKAVRGMERTQNRLDELYVKVIRYTLAYPKRILAGTFAILVLSVLALTQVPKTFMPTSDTGEFIVTIELPPGTNLNGTHEVAKKIDDIIRSNREVLRSVMIVGSPRASASVGTFFIELVPSKERRGINTTAVKDKLRGQLKQFADVKPIIKDVDMVGVGMRPFTVNIIGDDLKEIEKYANLLFAKLKDHPALSDPEISYKPGKPEFQVVIDNKRAERLGVSTATVGMELRTQVEGSTPALFREKGRDYDIRVRMKEDQRNLRSEYAGIYVPNINYSLVRLSDVANPVDTTGPASIDRQDRSRYIQIAADISANGPGMGKAISDVHALLAGEIKLPAGMRYAFVGQAENFKEMITSMMIAGLLGILFIFFVLASLYESFVTPLTIMLVLPLAVCGAFFGLFIGRQTLDIFSMIGCIMLLGVATKNSILLVDYANQAMRKGLSLNEAILQAGRTRLRPILMTTGALIAGMLPIAIGLNEASKMRTSMGFAVIGGLVSSTLLTLVVVPAAYSYIERLRVWSGKVVRRIFLPKSAAAGKNFVVQPRHHNDDMTV